MKGQRDLANSANTTAVLNIGRTFPEDVEKLLLSGFVDPSAPIGHGDRKSRASKLRARCAAVEVALKIGPNAPLSLVAERVCRTERNLHQQFSRKEALLAFPPPELATALVFCASRAECPQGVPGLLRIVFEQLDHNPEGRSLILGLVALRRMHPALRYGDNYFATALWDALETKGCGAGARAACFVGFSTESLRYSFIEWSKAPNDSLVHVLDRFAEMITDASTWRLWMAAT